MAQLFSFASSPDEPKGLVLRVEVSITSGRPRGESAQEKWRALLKGGLWETYGKDFAMSLLEPSRSEKPGSNVDCAGVLVDSIDQKEDCAFVTLRFLGTAGVQFACASVQCIQIMLTNKQADYAVQGEISRLQALGGSGWRDINIPLSGADLIPHVAPMVDLGEMPPWRTFHQQSWTNHWRLETLSSLLWRSKGLPVKQPPGWPDLANLISTRFERYATTWGRADDPASLQTWRERLNHMRALPVHCRDSRWQFIRRCVGEKQYSGSGHRGWVTYEGALDEAAWDCLRLGSFLQLCQQTSIGRGRYTFQLLPTVDLDDQPEGA